MKVQTGSGGNILVTLCIVVIAKLLTDAGVMPKGAWLSKSARTSRERAPLLSVTLKRR